MARHPERVPQRQPEVDFGWWQTDPGTVRRQVRLTWNPTTGALYLFWPPGQEILLCAVADRAAVRQLIAGLDPERRGDLGRLIIRARALDGAR